jgi:hypothetical protein
VLVLKVLNLKVSVLHEVVKHLPSKKLDENLEIILILILVTISKDQPSPVGLAHRETVNVRVHRPVKKLGLNVK